MGSSHLRIALVGVAFALVGALQGGCGGGDGLSTTAAERPAGAASGSADDTPEARASEPEPTKAARSEGKPTSKKARPESGEPAAGGDESPRQEGDRSGAKRQGRPLEKFNELVEGRLEQGSRRETRALRRLAEETLADPGAGTTAPGGPFNEITEAILGDE